jgi:hypothetical protein
MSITYCEEAATSPDRSVIKLLRTVQAGSQLPNAIIYQPASRYWRFQWTETGLYLALALALAGYCFGRLSRLS